MATINFHDFKAEAGAPSPERQYPYGVRMIGAPIEWKKSKTKGEHSKVLVIDGGKVEHKDINVVEHLGEDRTHYHAIHVAGIIAANGEIVGVAPEVQLYTANGIDGDWHEIADFAIAKGIDVANISLGWSEDSTYHHEAIQKMHDAGIIVVSSAGNSGEDGLTYPAKHKEVIAVSAINIEKERADFSSIGEDTEICAAGYRVWSTWPDDRFAPANGTSMASPHITGAIALMQSKAKMLHGRNLSTDEVRMILHNRAVDLGEEARNPKYGYGVFSFGSLRRLIMKNGKKEYTVNGQKKNMDTTPYINDDNRTMVPARFVAEGLGYNVHWSEDERIVEID